MFRDEIMRAIHHTCKASPKFQLESPKKQRGSQSYLMPSDLMGSCDFNPPLQLVSTAHKCGSVRGCDVLGAIARWKRERVKMQLPFNYCFSIDDYKFVGTNVGH